MFQAPFIPQTPAMGLTDIKEDTSNHRNVYRLSVSRANALLKATGDLSAAATELQDPPSLCSARTTQMNGMMELEDCTIGCSIFMREHFSCFKWMYQVCNELAGYFKQILSNHIYRIRDESELECFPKTLSWKDLFPGQLPLTTSFSELAVFLNDMTLQCLDYSRRRRRHQHPHQHHHSHHRSHHHRLTTPQTHTAQNIPLPTIPLPHMLWIGF